MSYDSCPIVFSRLLIALLLLLPANVQADVFSLGVTGGMNVTKVKGEKVFDLDGWNPASEKGWFVGGKLKVVGEMTGFGADLSATYSYEALSLSPDHQDVAHCLSVPIHFRWEMCVPILEYAFVPFVFAGPQFSWQANDLDFGLDKSVMGNLNELKVHWDDAVWKVDLGAGFLLFQRTELFYTYTFPLQKSFSIRTAAIDPFLDQEQEFVENYKTGVHRVGLTIYF